MRHQSITLLLALAVIAAGCGKSNYAQVEPDDLYFTHKDRKAVFGEEVIPGSPMVTTVEPTEVPTEYERSEYSDQHSPVFETPYGSPTIQQYGQKPYYDTTVNPDYLYEEDYSDLDNTSSAYFDENYSYQAPPAYETPVVNNYYYGLPGGYSYPSSMWLGSSYYTSYRPWRTSVYIGYDPYGWYYPSYYYSGYYSSYYSGWYDPYYAWGGSYYNPYCGFGNTYYGGGYGNYYSTTYNNNFDSYYKYKNGTKVVTQPRQSRNQVSYEVDKDNLPIKSRRADYIPQAEGASGRVASTTSRSSSETSPTISRRGSSSVYQYTNNENRGKDGQNMGTRNSSTVTVQQTRNSAQSRYSNNRTVVVPTRTRSTYTNRESAGSQDRYTRTNNANRTTSNRSAVNKRTTTPTTRYSNTTTRTRSSNYGTRSNNSSRSRSIFGTRSSGSSNSSGTRTRSYTPSRSSSGFSTPSRSSGSSSRSYTPSRSSSSRSSGTKSSSSSSGRSSGRRN